MFWKNERWFYDIEATSKYMLYLPPETERVRNQAGVRLPTQSDDPVQRLLLALKDGGQSSGAQNFQVTYPGLSTNIERLRVPEQLMRVTPALEAQLNERQRKMMQSLVEGKELTTRQCEMEFDVTRSVTSVDFGKLVEMGL